jgi:hypothetical protein
MRDEELRIRLEGGAELLEAARLRFRTLVPALSGLGWKDKVRRNVEVLREVAGLQPQVDAALALVKRRASAEGWPDGPLVRGFSETASLRAELEQRVATRLGKKLGLVEGLVALEAAVVFAPRLVLPGSRWAVTCEVLPTTAPFVQQARAFGEQLQRLFGPRRDDETSPVAASDDELVAFERGWWAGQRALDQAFERLDTIDLTGGTRRSLVRRARRPQVTLVDGSGAAMVLHAVHWREAALAHQQRVLTAKLEPAQVQPHERLVVYLWLARRAKAGGRLELKPRPRAALLELAALLRGQLGATPTLDGFGSLRTLATEADAAPDDPDWRRVLESLKLVMRVMAAPDAFLPPVRRVSAPRPRAPPLATSLSTCLDVLQTQLDRGRR